MTAMPCVWEPITNPDRTTNIDAHIDVHDETYYFIKFTNLQIYKFTNITKLRKLKFYKNSIRNFLNLIFFFSFPFCSFFFCF